MRCTAWEVRCLYVSPSILRVYLYLNNAHAHCTLTLQSSHKTVSFQGNELLDPAEFSEFFQASASLLPIAQSKPAFFGPDSAIGMPSNPRMQLARLWLQLGTLLVTPEWPCVMLIHCSKDTAVPVDSPRALHARLQDAKVETTRRIVPDVEHVFDLKPSAARAGILVNCLTRLLRAAVLDA